MHFSRITITATLLLVLVVVNAPGAMAVEQASPLRLWGSLSTTYRERDLAGGDNSDSWLNTGTISGSSYIWRPWFATFNGALQLSVEEEEADNQEDSKDEFTTGDVQLGVFPTSRFPFRAFYSETRDEFDSETFDTITRTTEYGLNQQYRTPDGRQNYFAQYDNEDEQLDNGNRFVSDDLMFGASNRIGGHVFDTDLSLREVENRTLGERVENDTFSVEHGYGRSRSFNIDNLLSATSTENDLIEARREFDTSQLSSFVSWNPGDRSDIRVTGNLRLTQNESVEEQFGPGSSGVTERENSSANLNQGLIYDYTANLQFSESINANLVDTNGSEQFVASESLGARYTSDRSETGLGDYGWNASTLYSNLHGDIDSEYTVDSQFNHSLANDFSVPNRYLLRSDLTQSFNYEFESEREDDKSVNHSYSLTWSRSANTNQNQVRLFISDTRELDRDNDYFQLFNLQYDGKVRLGRYEQLNGNVTLQLTRNKEEGLEGSDELANGEIEYMHNRAFGVVGLSFISELQLSRRLSDAEQLLEDQDTGTDIALENTLRYQIGRLEIEAELDIIRLRDEYDRLFKFKLTRSFGDL